jgi:hypothetical protein
MALYLRERTDKWDYMKLKIFYTTTKKWSPELGGCTQKRKNLDSFISDGLITRIYRELKNLTLQKNRRPNEEMGK